MNSIIVCAANRLKADPNVIILGIRHYDKFMRDSIARMGKEPHNMYWEQGFVDQYGKFYNRIDALALAKENSQIRRSCGSGDRQLFSENLY